MGPGRVTTDYMFSDGTPLPQDPFDEHLNGHAVARAEPTTWEPVDLGPYLRGEIQPITPVVGACRTDGKRMLYPGLEHAVIAHTGAGKTWFGLACAVPEILNGNTVVYMHFEESNAASTVERLKRIGLDDEIIQRQLLFVAPSRPARAEWLALLTAARPSLAIIDGVNEAMVLHGMKIDLEGWSAVRRRIVVPFKEIGAAVLECDHLPLSADPLRGDAYGTVHKGNVIDGARFALVRKKRFGRGRRGVANLYATKDRPGFLGADAADDDGDNIYLGTMVVDDSPEAGPDFLTLYAPKRNPDGESADSGPRAELADIVFDVIAALPGQSAKSTDLLYASVRAAGHQYMDKAIRDAAADLVVAERVAEVFGKRGAKGYRAITAPSTQPSTSARDEADSDHADDPGA
jgi:hypothetical protein